MGRTKLVTKRFIRGRKTIKKVKKMVTTTIKMVIPPPEQGPAWGWVGLWDAGNLLFLDLGDSSLNTHFHSKREKNT